MTNERSDVLIVGGGPVGLAAALHARRRGMSVTLLERRASPVDKACGEGLMPEAVEHLQQLGVDPDGWPIIGIRYLDGVQTADALFKHGSARGVRRTTLQSAMLGAAIESGVRIVEHDAQRLRLRTDHVEVDDFDADYLIAADGLHSPVRRALGLDRSAVSGPDGRMRHATTRARFGVRAHFAVPPWTDFVEVHWTDVGELYVTPVADHLVGVALLGTRPLDLPGTIANVPGLSAHLASVPVATTPRGAGPLRQDVRARVVHRVLLVGDAAGYLDALTGEGMRIGFAQAEAAVSCIAVGDPKSYEQQWRSITRSYRAITQALLTAGGFGPTRSLIVPAARALPGVFDAAVATLA
jgi:flavin-dependent dehydrogenase